MLFRPIPFASGSEQGKGGSLTFIPLTTLAGLSSPFLRLLYTQQRTENTEKQYVIPSFGLRTKLQLVAKYSAAKPLFFPATTGKPKRFVTQAEITCIHTDLKVFPPSHIGFLEGDKNLV